MKNLSLLFILFCFANNMQAQSKKKKTPAATVAKKKTTTTPQQNNTTQNDTDENDNFGLNLGKGSALTKGTSVLDFGIGFNYYGIPIHAAGEKLVVDNISVGAYANYMNFNNIGFIGSTYSYHLLYLGVKGNYYFNQLLGYGSKKYHLYAGLNIGYAKLITSDNSFSGYNSRPFLGGQIGVRYFFNKKFGVFAEGDYSGIGGGTIGLSIKLK
jgi:hypothetical protein